MKILVLGSGGREHALSWKIAQSSKCKELFIAPGNPGTAGCGRNVPVKVDDFTAIGKFVLEKKIKLVVVGPEIPLVKGIHDYFSQHKELMDVCVIGPSLRGAQLEGSKEFAKKFMLRNNIPTALYESFTKKTLERGLSYLSTIKPPIVLKADGLAAGKGVVICASVEHAKKEFKEMLCGKFGDASRTVIVEQFLSGTEFSVFVLSDGTSYKILPIAKDYKRAGEGDTGPNTGGMGAISPVPFVDDELLCKVKQQIIKPTVNGLKNENITYKGFIYFGLINVAGNPYVIEYNVRLGDPETEAVLPRIKSDFVDLLEGVMKNNLEAVKLEVDTRATATVVLASGGYPENYLKGMKVTGLDKVTDSIVFHAGTSFAESNNNEIVTSGGRVFAITSFGNNIETAMQTANKNAQKISFDGKYYRKDIGVDMLNQELKKLK